MSCLKLLGVLVAALAVTLGSVAKFKPELFLRLPFGFIPWAVTGGPMPPYFQPAVWTEENSKSFLSDGDVVVASGAKAGTFWLLTIVHLIRTGGDDSYERVVDMHGLVELLQYPGQTPAQAIETQLKKKADNPSVRPWCWWGHSSPSDPKLAGLNPPSNPHIKYINIVRDGKEVIRSMFPFINAHTAEYKRLWGSFPPTLSGPQETFQMFAVDMPHFFFEYTRDWWSFRNEPNVLLLHFADLKTDLKSSVQKIARFLEIELSTDTLQAVIEKASFKYMKEHHTKKVELCVSGYPGEKRICAVESGGHINKGELGHAEEFFTPDMNEKWDTMVEQYFGGQPGLAEWTQKGGPFK